MSDETSYRASLSALWVETLLYGAYFILFAGYIRVHIKRGLNKYLFVIAATMFILSTASVVTDFVNFLLTPGYDSCYLCGSYDCFVYDGDLAVSNDDNLNNLARVLYTGLFTTNQVIADALLTYRCLVVWQHKKRIIIMPALLVAATAATGFTQTYTSVQIYRIRFQHHILSDVDSRHCFALGTLQDRSVYANSALSACSNMVVTILIVARIWALSRDLKNCLGEQASMKYKAIISMMLESGAMYTALQIANLILELASSTQYYLITYSAVSQVVGIAPTLMMVRVGLSEKNGSTAPLNQTNIFNMISPLSRHLLTGAIGLSDKPEMSTRENFPAGARPGNSLDIDVGVTPPGHLV